MCKEIYVSNPRICDCKCNNCIMNIDEYLNSVNSMKSVFGNLVIICHCVFGKNLNRLF